MTTKKSQLAAVNDDLSIFVSNPEEFNDDRVSLPRIQAVRGENPNQWGYFIASDQLAISDWVNFDPDKTPIVEQLFQQGVETGILIQNPRFLVCPKSPILALDKKQSEAEKKVILLGRYSKDKHGDDENITCVQYYWAFLLDENNELMHNIPFSLRCKGANLGSFSVAWQEFTTRLNSCFYMAMKAKGASPKPKNNKFNCLAVFVPELKRDMVGKTKKNYALRIVGYEEPTMENWINYFAGGNAQLREQVWAAFDPENYAFNVDEPRLIQQVDTPALPPQQYQALPGSVPVQPVATRYASDDGWMSNDIDF